MVTPGPSGPLRYFSGGGGGGYGLIHSNPAGAKSGGGDGGYGGGAAGKNTGAYW